MSVAESEPADTSAAEQRRSRTAAPTSSEAYDHLSLDDLRALRHNLNEQETRVSYWRRILQARIDLLIARDDKGAVSNLSHVLADGPSSHRRLAHITIDPIDDVAPLPDLPRLWSRVADPANAAEVDALVADLRDAERRVSELRSELFVRIDSVTAELIARFHDNPSLALVALPRR